MDNLLKHIPENLPVELFQTLWSKEELKIERIISRGHSTPDGQWYCQDWDEWVLLLQGEAQLAYENNQTINLKPGDYLLIPAHTRHRVAWTASEENTLWLAVHYAPGYTEHT